MTAREREIDMGKERGQEGRERESEGEGEKEKEESSIGGEQTTAVPSENAAALALVSYHCDASSADWPTRVYFPLRLRQKNELIVARPPTGTTSTIVVRLALRFDALASRCSLVPF